MIDKKWREQAEKLNISVKCEFAESAFSSQRPSKLGERCTVFMENSLMANLQKGASKNDLFAGLAYSIVQNYINRVVAGKRIAWTPICCTRKSMTRRASSVLALYSMPA